MFVKGGVFVGFVWENRLNIHLGLFKIYYHTSYLPSFVII